MYTHVWYELSGLPTYGVNLDSGEVARQSYTLKVGRRNIEERGEWKVVGKLTEEQLVEVNQAIMDLKCPTGLIESFLLANGSLVPSVSSDGTPITIRAREAEALAKGIPEMIGTNWRISELRRSLGLP